MTEANIAPTWTRFASCQGSMTLPLIPRVIRHGFEPCGGSRLIVEAAAYRRAGSIVARTATRSGKVVVPRARLNSTVGRILHTLSR